MTIPPHVEVGPYVYSVAEDGPVNDAAHSWAHCDNKRLSITLDPHQHGTHKRMALLHEILHGIFHVVDNSRMENEERVCEVLSPMLLDVLRRNPALVAYLMAED